MAPLVDVQHLLDCIAVLPLELACAMRAHHFGVVQVVHYIKQIFKRALTQLIVSQIQI